MIEIQIMNLDETKEVNPIRHVGGPSKIKEHPKTFEKQYRIPKYEPRETKIEQLGNTRVYLDIDCDAPNPGCPLTTRQPAENLYVSYLETHT